MMNTHTFTICSRLSLGVVCVVALATTAAAQAFAVVHSTARDSSLRSTGDIIPSNANERVYRALSKVYLLYSSATKKQATSLKKSLAGSCEVKTYNVRVLALADYSGRQKAIAKFNRAELIIVLGKKAANSIKGAKLAQPVVLVDVGSHKIGSKEHILSVVSKAGKPAAGVKQITWDAKAKASKTTLEASDEVVASGTATDTVVTAVVETLLKD